jgi:hypothetical protein
MFDEEPDGDPHGECAAEIRRLQAALARPIDMVLFCPDCGLQHIDAPEPIMMAPPGFEHAYTALGATIVGEMNPGRWRNPPHRSHLCVGCGHIWRPADVPTNGVAAVKTQGMADSPLAMPARRGRT